MRKISLEKLDGVFAAIAATAKLYIPVDGEGGAKFEEWGEGKKLSHALNTTRSPKDFFFPQSENLMEFQMNGKEIKLIDVREESEDFVIFGVRPCDVRSFDVLDRVFLSDVPDSYYASRREHGVIVSLACTKPGETCFCRTFGIDAAEPEGDVAAWMTGSDLYLEAKSEKGEKLLSAATVPRWRSRKRPPKNALTHFRLRDFPPKASARARPRSISTPPNGRSCPAPAWAAEPAPSSVPPASATT